MDYTQIPTAKDVFQQYSFAERINLYKKSSTFYGEVKNKAKSKFSVPAQVLDLFNVDCKKLGWIPQISRDETEEILEDSPPKTFILRWSDRMSSLVLSYTERPGNAKRPRKVDHIGWIFLQFALGTTLDNIPVQVKQEGGKETTYTNIYSYMEQIRETIEVSAVELYENNESQNSKNLFEIKSNQTQYENISELEKTTKEKQTQYENTQNLIYSNEEKKQSTVYENEFHRGDLYEKKTEGPKTAQIITQPSKQTPKESDNGRKWNEASNDSLHY